MQWCWLCSAPTFFSVPVPVPVHSQPFIHPFVHSFIYPFISFHFISFFRQHKLDESLAYQQFSANLDEEESWINEKYTLVGSDDYGDTLAAVQVNCVHFLQITPSCSVGCA